MARIAGVRSNFNGVETRLQSPGLTNNQRTQLAPSPSLIRMFLQIILAIHAAFKLASDLIPSEALSIYPYFEAVNNRNVDPALETVQNENLTLTLKSPLRLQRVFEVSCAPCRDFSRGRVRIRWRCRSR